MNTTPDKIMRPNTQSETERELFSDKKDAFLEAVDCLYIPNNMSARTTFSEKWPEAAVVLFDDELVRFDYDGVQNDEERARRTELEMLAEDRRMQMAELFSNIGTRLVHQGSLQLEPLKALMKELNRPIAEYIFAERFVNRYFPLDGQNAATDGTGQGIDSDDDLSISKKEERGSYGHSPALILKTETKPSSNRPIVRNIVNVSEVVPEKSMDSIGHVDHSYNASAPNYTEDEAGEPEEDMSWLDVTEEDEFGDVKPISVGDIAVPAKAEPAPDPVSFSRPASEQERSIDDKLSPEPAKEGHSELPPGITQIQQPRRPSLSEPEDGIVLSGAGSVSGSLSGMSFTKKNDAQDIAPAASSRPLASSPPALADAPALGGNESLKAPEAATPAKDEKPAPRVPRLEDLDKHVPPIPGSEEDDSSGRY